LQIKTHFVTVKTVDNNETSPITETEIQKDNTQRLGLIRKKLLVRRIKNNPHGENVSAEQYHAHTIETYRLQLAQALTELFETAMPPHKQDETNAHILDIAAGTGVITEALEHKGYQVTAMDSNEDYLRFLKDRLPETDVQVADMNNPFPFPDNYFDGITSVKANRFITNPEHFLTEIRRVMKPNGLFIWPIFMNDRKVWKHGIDRGQPTKIDDLADLARKVGFKVTTGGKDYPNTRSTVPMYHTFEFIAMQK
jgi:2-polyprenyl-3-methyl-5-hydroxy-6-metoxy-1,4-benzoquinol methylase